MNPRQGILLAHPTANQNVRQTALALAEANLLREFWTCISWREGGLLDRTLSILPKARAELRRRSFAHALQPFIKTDPWREWARLLLRSFSIDQVYDAFDRQVARRIDSLGDIAAVYAYDGGANTAFRAAERNGAKRIYEHPIIYWRKVRELQREEAELQPAWAPTLLALHDSEEKLARKDEELAAADIVVTACSFARESLPKLNATVQVIPYGAPEVKDDVTRQPNEKLRILFVGALTQAKGLSYLFTAAERLKQHVDLTLIGHRVNESIPAPSLLDRHRWIPSLSHEKLLAEMGRHDVLILPSLHEGFGLVILEAMSQGTPVITTSHTGGPDVIQDGLDGFIVPIRSADAIAEKFELLLQDRQRLPAMSAAAREKARLHSWPVYRERVAALARDLIAN